MPNSSNAQTTVNVDAPTKDETPEQIEQLKDDTTPETLPLDKVFDTLKNQRRRRVLRYLGQCDGQVSLSDLAEQIAAWENDKEVRQITSSERKRVYVGLYQCHLPKMDSLDVVEFNKPRGTIEPGPHVDRLYDYLDFADQTGSPPFHRYSVALSLVGAAALAVALLAGSLTSFPVVGVTVTATVLGMLAYGAAGVHWYWTHTDDEVVR